MTSIGKPKKILFGLISIFLLVIVADSLFRGYLILIRDRDTSPSSMETRLRAHFDTFESTTPSNLRGSEDGESSPRASSATIHPFYGFEDRYDLHGVLRYFEQERKEEDYVVVILGGSVASVQANRQDNTFRAAVAGGRGIDENQVKILNSAHGAYKQPQQVMALSFLLSQGFVPDVVINIDGFNEVAISAHNASLGVRPEYPSVTMWEPLVKSGIGSPDSQEKLLTIFSLRKQADRLLANSLRFKAHYSAMLGTYIDSLMRRLRHNYLRNYSEWIAELAKAPTPSKNLAPPYTSDVKNAIASSADLWFESSLTLKSLCDGRSIEYLHFLQPTLLDPGKKELTEDEEEVGDALPEWTEGVKIGYPLLLSRSKEFPGKNISFFDCSGIFQKTKKTLYIDCCHYNTMGNDILGAFIAAQLGKVVSQ